MKKLYFLLLFTTAMYSQNTHFGAQLGFEFYDIQLDGNMAAGTAFSGLNFGGFVDHKINDSFGIKGSISYCKIREDHYEFMSGGLASGIFEESNLSMLQFQALAKLDVNKSYRKGFFLAGGLRLNNIMDVSTDEAPEYENGFYNSSNLALLLGFGSSLTKYASFELLFDYGLGNTVKAPGVHANTVGFMANLNIDVSAMVR